MALDLSDKAILDWITSIAGSFKPATEQDLEAIPIGDAGGPTISQNPEGKDQITDFVKRVMQGISSDQGQGITPEGYYYPKTTAFGPWEDLTNQRPGYIEKPGATPIPQNTEVPPGPSRNIEEDIFGTGLSTVEEAAHKKFEYTPEDIWSEVLVPSSKITLQGTPTEQQGLPASVVAKKPLDLEALVGPQEPTRDYQTELMKLAQSVTPDISKYPFYKPNRQQTLPQAISNAGRYMGAALGKLDIEKMRARDDALMLHDEAIEKQNLDSARAYMMKGDDRRATMTLKGWEMAYTERKDKEKKEFEYYNMIGQRQPGIWKQPQFIAAIARAWGVDLKRAAAAIQSLVDPTTGLLPNLGITKYEEWTNMEKTKNAYMSDILQKAGYTPEMISEFKIKGKFDPDSFWKDQMTISQGDPVKEANFKTAYSKYLKMSKISGDIEKAELFTMMKVLPSYIQDPKALKYVELSFLNKMMGIKGNIPASVFTDTEVKTAEQLMLPFVQSGLDVIMGVPGAQEVWDSRFKKLGVDPPSPMIVSKYLMETVSDQDFMKFDVKVGYALSRLPISARSAFIKDLASGGTGGAGYTYLVGIYDKDVKPYSDELARWEKEAKVSIPPEERDRLLEGIMRAGKMPNKTIFINELKAGVGKGT